MPDWVMAEFQSWPAQVGTTSANGPRSSRTSPGTQISSSSPLHWVCHWLAVFLRAITWPFHDTFFPWVTVKPMQQLRHQVLQTHPVNVASLCRHDRGASTHWEIGRSLSSSTSSDCLGLLQWGRGSAGKFCPCLVSLFQCSGLWLTAQNPGPAVRGPMQALSWVEWEHWTLNL